MTAIKIKKRGNVLHEEGLGGITGWEEIEQSPKGRVSCPWSQGLSHAVGNGGDVGEDVGEDMGQPVRGPCPQLGHGHGNGNANRWVVAFVPRFTWTTANTVRTVQSEGNSFFWL